VRDEPTDLKAQVRLAELDESAGRWKDAASTWRALAARNGASAQLRMRYASALVNSGDLAGSRDVIASVTKDSPTDISAWYLTSQSARGGGDGPGAEAGAKKIGEIDPKDPRGPLALADARVLQKDYAGAAAIIEPLVNGAGDAEVAAGLYARFVADLA